MLTPTVLHSIPLGRFAQEALSRTLLVFDAFYDVEAKAKAGNTHANAVRSHKEIAIVIRMGLPVMSATQYCVCIATVKAGESDCGVYVCELLKWVLEPVSCMYVRRVYGGTGKRIVRTCVTFE